MNFRSRLALTASVLFLAGLAIRPAHAGSQRTRIDLDDRSIIGWFDSPKSEGPHPFLIIAADPQSDEKDSAYLKLAKTAVAEGFVSLRFKPSADAAKGAEELGVVIGMVGSRMMKQFEIDPAKVVLVAKGSAATVAMAPESGGAGEKVKATLLIDPVCEAAEGSFAKTYAPFLAAKTPRMIVAAKGGACALPQIYAAAKDFGDSVSLYASAADNADVVLPAFTGWIRSLGWSAKAPAGGKRAGKKPDAKKHVHDAQSAGTHP